MLLFGFSVLAVLLCGDVFSGAIGDADHKQENGIYSNYCEKSRSNSYTFLNAGRPSYPPTPIECCSGPEMRCKSYINPGETKFNLTNEDDSWPIRKCSCEHKLFDCLKELLSARDKSRAQDMLDPERCFEAIGCDGKSTSICNPENKVVTVMISRLGNQH